MTSTSKPHVVILGAGPAGLGAAFRLSRLGRARVTVLERNDLVGGNAGSFDLAGLRVDFGSHRLPPDFAVGVAGDMAIKMIRKLPLGNGYGSNGHSSEDSFASVLQAGL